MGEISKLTRLEIEKIIRKAQSDRAKKKNLAKHYRIANATVGHEHDVHVKKLEKLLSKYNKQREYETNTVQV